MNYSTIKKAVASTMIAALGFATAAEAQEPAKVFGGRSQYRTWSIGINAGALAPQTLLGTRDQSKAEINLGYGAYLKKQFSPVFSLQADFLKGKLSGTNEESNDWFGNGTYTAGQNFETDLTWQTGLTGNFQLGTVDFLRRENAVGFFFSTGVNVANYEVTNVGGQSIASQTNFSFPAGLGVKFKLGEVVNLDLGYKMYFLDADDIDGQWTGSTKDTYSYGYGGLEFLLGSTSKPSLQWSNPVAAMYDELMDPSLRNEVEALKQRVTTLEGLVDELGKDSDGDGVSDKFDKCPNTPAGTVVDGSGCPIKFPEPEAKAVMGDYSAIQFEFDSYVLKTSSYPTLDKVSQDLRDANGNITLEGYASAEGTEAYNLQLSKDRANAVKNYLVNSGVAADKVNVIGYGEANPIASNATEAGRVQNRRVEFKK
ncbi:MAG TPA: OmpA family protein [Sphingobacteriaceae bacterium]|nr:OmpA family protein [Sphingobacteriaceae bacterium]